MDLQRRVFDRAATAFVDQPDMLQKVVSAVKACPALLVVDDANSVKTILDGLSISGLWGTDEKWAISRVLYRRAPTKSEEYRLKGSHLAGGNYTEKGECALNSCVSRCLPKPLDADAAERLWTKVQWDHCIAKSNSIENVVQSLQEVVNVSNCNFEMVIGGESKSFCKGIKLGVILKLRNHFLSLFTIGAIIKLDSKVASVDSYSIGELVKCGEVFLEESGPERDSIVLGITDMETIRWFCVSRSTDCLRVAQIAITTDVRGSIGAFLCAKPGSLGLDLKLEIHKLPSSWRLVKHLGSGRTSHVYLVVENGNWSRLVLKVPRPGFRLDLDIHYLNALADVDGIPKVYQQINSMLAIQPVGEPFSCEDVTSYRAKGTSLSVADLVEVLQYAHKRGIANRDLRPENIMIAESLHNKGEIRLFILDWGFATKIGQISAFSGSVVTASDCVLQQLRCGENEVVKMTANDDLISLVRCLYLIFNPEASSGLHTISGEPKEIEKFWKQQMEKSLFWSNAQEDALQLRYGALKDQLLSL